MPIQLKTIEQVYQVTKPWGWEKWIQAGSDVYPFVLKQLLLKKGQKTSLQVHQFKSESILILEGNGQLLTFNGFFDCQKHLADEYTTTELDFFMNNLTTYEITKGDVFDTPPGTIHRMIAITDLLYIEASTTQLDDVIRLSDEQNRANGRIEIEHKGNK